VAVVVLDAGPILHDKLIRFEDPDIETGLEQSGHSSESARYRLLQIDLSELEDMRWIRGAGSGRMRPNPRPRLVRTMASTELMLIGRLDASRSALTSCCSSDIPEHWPTRPSPRLHATQARAPGLK
jgi:hypothetical protein